MSPDQMEPNAAVLVHTAKEEAAALRHRQVDTCHLLLALLKIDGIPKQILGDAGVTYSRVRAHVVDALGEGEGEVGALKLTPRAWAVLQEAERESPVDDIRPEHALLGLLAVVGSGDFPFATDPLKLRQEVVRASSTVDGAACRFCGAVERDVAKLIAGPDDVYICERCVIRSATVMRGGDDEHLLHAPDGSRCSYCRQPAKGGKRPAFTREGSAFVICTSCVELCGDILAVEMGAKRPLGRRKRTDAGRSEADLVKCSFCTKSQKEVQKLIAGPGVYVCDECIAVANRSIAQGVQKPDDNRLQCGFCEKTPAHVKDFIAGSVTNICGECIALCNDIIREDPTA